jgi:hypothetical protein
MEFQIGEYKMKKIMLTAMLLGATLNVQAQNLIQNGSFEDVGTGEDFGQFWLFTDANPLPNWDRPASVASTVVQSYVEGGSWHAAPVGFGEKWVELSTIAATGQTSTSGGITQSIAGLAAGEQYDLSFYYAARPDAGASAFDVIWNTDTPLSFTAAATSAVDWTLYQTTVTAGSSNSLSFLDTSNVAEFGARIDGVSLTAVSAVPEPETYAMFLAGLGLLGFASRKRKA